MSEKVRKPIIFICSPYRGASEDEVHENIQYARHYAKLVWRLGGIAICPQMNSAFFGGSCDERNFIEGYLQVVDVVDALFVTPHPKIIKSSGCRAEQERAFEAGTKIIRTPDTLEVYIKRFIDGDE